MPENPYRPTDALEPSKAPRLLNGFLGAIAGAFAFAQTLSVLGYFVDVAVEAGQWFRIAGSMLGFVLGILLGAIAGVRIAKGRSIRLWPVVIGGVIFCAVYSSSLFVVTGETALPKVTFPFLGLVSGAVVGGILSTFLPSSRGER